MHLKMFSNLSNVICKVAAIGSVFNSVRKLIDDANRIISSDYHDM